MTTAAQVKKLVKPLLEKHPELVLVGRMIVWPPVRHVLRAIYIDRTRSGDEFNPRWAVMHLFDVIPRIHFTHGGDIDKPRATAWPHGYPELWWIDDPESPAVLIEAIEASVLPKLAPLGDLETYYAHLTSYRQGQWNSYTYEKRPEARVIVEAARGRLDEVRAICRDELSKWPNDAYGTRPEEIDLIRLPKMICQLAAVDDRAGIAGLLHAWEAATVRSLKIEPLWEPSPFPLELGASQY